MGIQEFRVQISLKLDEPKGLFSANAPGAFIQHFAVEQLLQEGGLPSWVGLSSGVSHYRFHCM